MALFAYTLDQLVEQCAKLLLHDFTEGTATGGSGVTLEDTSRLEVDDFFNSKGSYIYIRSGTYAGSLRKITNFANTGGIITFSPTLAGNIVSGVTYSIHTDYSRDEVVDAINLAIDMVAEEAHIWKIDETSITLVAAQYEYSLPTDFMFIYRVTMADSDGNFYDEPIDPTHYLVIPGATPKLKFPKFPPSQKFEGHEYGRLFATSGFTAGRLLRVEGLGSPAALTTDASTCSIDPSYVVYQAAAILHSSRIRRPENEPDDHRTQAGVCQIAANTARVRVVKMHLPPNCKRCRE